MTRRIRLKVDALDDRCLPSFSPAASYSVGMNPQDVVTGYFNDDGQLDVVTANPGSNTVSVLLGNPDGTFQMPLNSDTGFDAERLVAADFNNDDKLDLVAGTTQYYGGKSLFLGNGDGAFQTPIFIDLASSRDSLAAADFNADGNMDLVQVEIEPEFADYVQVYLGDGAGHFMRWGEPVYFSDYVYTPMVVADLNNDSRPDVVLAHEDNSYVSVLLCNADGTLSYHSYFLIGNSPRSVAVADFTGDGIPDIAAAGSTWVFILAGDGNGNFSPHAGGLTNNADQIGVATADFNGDGRLDLVTSDKTEGSLTAVLGVGDGTLFLVGDHAVGAGPVDVAVGDFNGDGRPDAVTANAGADTISVLLNDGTWQDVSLPRLRIDNVTVTEGHAGAVTATSTVTLSAASAAPITVQYSTADGTASAGSDYQASSGTLTIPAGQTTGTITVLVNGDRVAEANETFQINLSNPTNATILDGQAVATIADDEPRISINNVTVAEGGNGQTTLFTFTITLSAAYDQAVTISFRTANGTAKKNEDYVAKTGTLTFAPGETTKTITISVKGDSKREGSETFYIDLFGLSSNGLFTKNRGIGTILNDD